MLFDLSAHTADTSGMKQQFKVTKQVAESIAAASKDLKWPTNYTIANTTDSLLKLRQAIEDEGEFVFDCETLGLNAWKDRLLCISFWVGDQGYLVPFEHRLMQCVDKAVFKTHIGEFFSDPMVRIMNHNVKFDGHFVEQQLGIRVGKFYCDTLLQSQVINPDNTDPHGLKELCAQYGLAGNTGNYTAQFGKTAWSYIEPKLAAYYAIKDCELVVKLHAKQNEILKSKPKLLALFWDTEMLMLNETFEMERKGIRVDPVYIEEVLVPTVNREWALGLDAMRPYIEPHLTDGDDVRDVLESPAKLKRVFFDKLGLPKIKHVTLHRAVNPKTGEKDWTKLSLDKEAIVALSKDYPCVRLLSEYRKWATVKKLIVDPLSSMIVDGRIHPTMNSIGAATGRMSMQSPNFQQMPSRMGALVRNAFIPDEGNTFLSSDFSSQEMRILAHYTLDPGLIRFFTDPDALDPYSETAAMAAPDDDFKKEGLTREKFRTMGKSERKSTKVYAAFKALVLGLGFGMAPPKYARSTGIPLKQAVKNFDAYHAAFPGVKQFQEQMAADARRDGYITTLLGRQRPLREINNIRDQGLQSGAERAAANTPIQGSAAEMIKRALIDVVALCRRNKWPVRVALVIHDELLFELPIAWAKANPEAIVAITTAMENALPLAVPMVSSAVFAPRWGTNADIDDIDDLLLDAA